MTEKKDEKKNHKQESKQKEEKNGNREKAPKGKQPAFYKPVLAIAGIILIAAIAFFIYGFLTAKTAAMGDVVSIDYTGYFSDGALFDTTIAADAKGDFISPHKMEPISFTVGGKQVFAGLEEAVVGMKEGGQKTVLIPPSKAFGERDEKNVVEVNKTEFVNKGVIPKIGLQVQTSQGVGVITKVGNATVIVDFNNEFAGKSFNFKIIVRKITKKQ